MIDEKTIYDLKLHEAIAKKVISNGKHITTMLITRVPGGFLYMNDGLTLQTFVPYNDEFKKKEKGIDINKVF